MDQDRAAQPEAARAEGRLASKLRGRLRVIVPELEQEQKDVDRKDWEAGRTTNYGRAGSGLWAGASNVTGDWRLGSSGVPESDETRERERGGLRFRVGVRVKVRARDRDSASASGTQGAISVVGRLEGARAAAGGTYLPHNGAAATE